MAKHIHIHVGKKTVDADSSELKKLKSQLAQSFDQVRICLNAAQIPSDVRKLRRVETLVNNAIQEVSSLG